MPARSLKFAELYASESGRLRKLVLRVVGNAAIADDVVQQAFANLISGRNLPDSDAAYLARIVRNLAFNHLRDTRRRGEVSISEIDLMTLVDDRPSPEMVVLYRHELRRLLEAIAALPPRRREAFVLRRLEGLSYDEVAVRMGVTRNTVMTQIIAAMSELHRQFDRT